MVFALWDLFPFSAFTTGVDKPWVASCSLFRTRNGVFVVRTFCWKASEVPRQKFPASLRHCCNRSVIQSPVTGRLSHLFYFTAGFMCLQIILFSTFFALPCVCAICSFSVGTGALSGLSSLEQRCSYLAAKRASQPHHWEKKMSLST